MLIVASLHKKFNRKGLKEGAEVAKRSCSLAVLQSLYSRSDCMTARLHD
jgi:hypothetical protein